jgi:hypothetical protein
MYGVIGEDKSDVATLKVLIKRLAKNESLSVKTKGYSGCAEMLRKGAKQFHAWAGISVTKFIVCYDADKDPPNQRFKVAFDQILDEATASGEYCIVIPVQELEAWILADIAAVKNVFTSWSPQTQIVTPENIVDPKEHLEKLSRMQNNRPRYIHAVHNEVLARHLDLKVVAQKCISFTPLRDFVVNNVSHKKIP